MLETTTNPSSSPSKLQGFNILHNPRLNKSTAFTAAERKALGLVGLLPEGLEDEETQIQRVMEQLGHKTTDLDKYIYLSARLKTLPIFMPSRSWLDTAIASAASMMTFKEQQRWRWREFLVPFA